jgi:kelch-like protein 10
MSHYSIGLVKYLRKKNFICDAVLRLEDGRNFPVNREMLSACSAYFRTLLTTLHSKEKTDLLLPGVTSETLSLILEYAYKRNVNINQKNVCLLLESADYFSVLRLLEVCCEFLKSILVPENSIGIMRFAGDHGCFSLEDDACRFVMRKFVQVSKQSDQLLNLPLKELQAILGADKLNVKSEQAVWECVLRWIHHDIENRKGHILGLMKRVRLDLFGTKYVLKNIINQPYVTGNDECLPFLMDIFKFLHDLKIKRQKGEDIPTAEVARPRIPHEILFAIGGEGGMECNYIETYDPLADRWVLACRGGPTNGR